MSKQQITTEIAIIGAGYAGIAAGHKLEESRKDFVIIEARDRIGGRVHTQKLDNGLHIDLGAQWIGPTQHKIWELTKKYNVETFDTYDEGKNILFYNNKLTTYKGTIPKIDPFSLINLGLGLDKINRLCKKVPLDKPWSIPQAEKWDSMTVATWMDKMFWSKKAKYLFKVGFETVFACNPSEISMLQAMFYARSGDNMDTLISIPKGAQQTRFVKGSQHLLEKMSESFNDNIYLSEPVLEINQSADGVEIFTNGLQVSAKRCIITIPPALIDRIRFNNLSARRAQLHQRMPMGTAMKCSAIYDKPFWREKGLSGQIVSDRDPVNVTFDNSPKDGSCGVILTFVEADNPRDFIEVPEVHRKDIITSKQWLSRFLGKEALHPTLYIDKCWSEEEWSRGCYVGNFSPGGWTQFGSALREPCGRIHWSGTETAEKWCGYMDGAIESGYRAAGEVL